MTIEMPIPFPQNVQAASEESRATMADARAAIGTWIDLNSTRRRDLRDAVDTAVRIIAQPAMNIILDPPSLGRSLLGQPARTYGLSKRRHATVVSNLRYILRRLGLISVEVPVAQCATPEWRAALEALPDQYIRTRLARFVSYCSRKGIGPDMVDTAVFEAFMDQIQTSALLARPLVYGRFVTYAWGRLRQARPELSLQEVEWRLVPQRQYTLPLDTYPESFQRDIADFVAGLGPRDPASLFDELGELAGPKGRCSEKVVRRSTVKLRLHQIQLAAAALVLTGRAQDDIRSLRDLVDPFDSVRSIMNFYWARAERKPGSFVGGIAEVLRQIAKFHCRLGDTEVDKITQIRMRVWPRQQHGICPRNRERLRALVEPQTRGLLLHLPAELFRQAADEGDAMAAEQLAVCGTVLEIMLVCPLRISNLLSLRIDRHLRRDITGSRRITHIVLAPEEVKNATAIEWPISAETAETIQTWIDKYRIDRNEHPTAWLFPGRRSDGPRALSAFRTLFELEIQRTIGIRVNPHLLRHFAAWLFLKYHPGAYESVRRILGHRALTTTLAAYTGLEADAAAQALDDVVIRERKASRLSSVGTLAKQRRSSGHGRR